MTPNGEKYNGLAFQKGSCGVSIIRSGEAMEQGLRDCCRSIRIGKILIQVKLKTLKNSNFQDPAELANEAVVMYQRGLFRVCFRQLHLKILTSLVFGMKIQFFMRL